MALISRTILLTYLFVTCARADVWPFQISSNMSDPLSNPYNEHVIVDLVTEIYRLLLQLGHFEEDEVIWPPTGGHTLDFSLLDDSSRIDINVISLMQHLPFTGVGSRSTVVPTMRPVNYANPFELAMSRDIDKTDFRAPPSESRLNMGNAAPTVLLLLQGQESPDACLVLDIADSIASTDASCLFFR